MDVGFGAMELAQQAVKGRLCQKVFMKDASLGLHDGRTAIKEND